MDPDHPNYVLGNRHPLAWLPDWLYRIDEVPRIELQADSLRVVQRGPRGGTSDTIIPLAAIGHLELERPAKIHLRFGLRGGEDKTEITLTVSRFVAEDEFDSLVEALQQAIPQRNYSIVEDQVLRYALPGAQGTEQLPTSRATLRQTPLELRTDHSTFRVRHDAGFLLSRDDDAAGGPFLLANPDRVLDRNGTIVALVHRLHRRNLCLVLRSGETVHYHRGQRALFVDGERVGQALSHGNETTLELTRPLPELLPVLALLVAQVRPWLVTPQPLRFSTDEGAPSLQHDNSNRGRAWIILLLIGVPVAIGLQYLWMPGAAVSLEFLWVWVMFAPMIVLRHRMQQRFTGYPTHLEIPSPVLARKEPVDPFLRLTPWDIGQVTCSITGKLVVQHGVDTKLGDHRVEFQFDARRTERATAELRAHLDRTAPDHRYSWMVGETVHYNLPWEFADVLPWSHPTDRARLTILHGISTVATPDRSFSVRSDDGNILFGCAEVSEENTVLQLTRRHVLLANGMILGTRVGRSFRFGDGLAIRVEPGDGVVHVDGRPAGRIVITGDDAQAELDHAVADVALVLLLVAHATPGA